MYQRQFMYIDTNDDIFCRGVVLQFEGVVIGCDLPNDTNVYNGWEDGVD